MVFHAENKTLGNDENSEFQVRVFGRQKKLPVVILVHEILKVDGEGLEHLQFALAVDFVFDVIIGGVAGFR